MKIVHIVRDNYTPLALNGVYKVIDNISKALSDGGDCLKTHSSQNVS